MTFDITVVKKESEVNIFQYNIEINTLNIIINFNFFITINDNKKIIGHCDEYESMSMEKFIEFTQNILIKKDSSFWFFNCNGGFLLRIKDNKFSIMTSISQYMSNVYFILDETTIKSMYETFTSIIGDKMTSLTEIDY